MRRQTRDRLVLPLLLPIGLLALVGLVLYGFSRILLSISHNAATVVALSVAATIVILAAIVGSRQRVPASSLLGMLGAVAGVAMLAGGIALAAVGTEGAGPQAGPGAGGGIQTVPIVAQGIAFLQTKVTVPSGTPFRIEFDNRDAGVQHDVQIFDNADYSGTPLFKGDIITGPAKTTYEVPALEAGTYYFNCVVHPNMQGTMVAAEAGSQGGAAALTVTAKNLAFDTDRIELPADTASTITFDNQDAGIQHNIGIYTNEEPSKELFKGEVIVGPNSVTYEIPPLPAGQYLFQCDIHPTMNGTVVVRSASGGGSPPPGQSAGPSPTVSAGGVSPSASAAGSGGTVTTTLTAKGLSFDTSEIILQGGKASTISFTNDDAGVQHNLAIATDSSLSTKLFEGDLVTGVDTVDYSIPELDPGTYYFACMVHPTMNGTVTVLGA